jgi:hypothetical protein
MQQQNRGPIWANPFPAQSIVNFSPLAAGRNGTLIAVVLDESGSMGRVREATISGLNEFIEGQKSAEGAGDAYLTIVKFDAPKITTLFENQHVKSVKALTGDDYQPGGGTNLMDAIGHTMEKVNTVLNSVPQAERPGVLVVIVTDGEENSSNKYNTTQIKEMVKLSEAADWTFTFLGANVDAFSMGHSFGMQQANTVAYSTNSMGATMDVLSKTTTRVRMAKSAGVSTAELYASQSLYDVEDRSKMMGGKDA